jgi:aldehyde:ferredoxin oxidoreductase
VDFGRILEVDLSDGKISGRQVKEEIIKKFLGGSGLAAKILYDEADLSLDPFDPKNPLIFMAGLLTGTPIPGMVKLSVCSKSPLTEIWGESTVGGHWPPEFRATGYSGIIITGRADSPVYLWITESKAEVKSAEKVWGLDTFQTDDELSGQTDEKARVAAIGMGGEKLSRMASILFDGRNARSAGRCGMGAVMGSKNLKAIVVRGAKTPEVADREGLKAALKEDTPQIVKYTKAFSEFGTSGGVEVVEHHGDLPIKNWLLGSWEEQAKKVSGHTMQPKWLEKHYHCPGCPIGCGKIYKVPERGLHGHGPEYETIAGFGPLCLNEDILSIVEANEWCHKYSLDTISTASCIAFAMEAYERGLISKKDIGFELKWGDGKAVVEMIHQIAKQEGIGKLLAQGVMRAAKELGPKAEEFAVHTKGLEYPYHDPRAHFSMAPNYVTATRGADHLESLSYYLDRGVLMPDLGYTTPPHPREPEGKAKIAIDMQNYVGGVYNAIGLCKFYFAAGRVGPKTVAKWINLVTGWDFTLDDVMRAGERIFNLKRMYSVRLGVSRKDDVLPPRLARVARPDGMAGGALPPMDVMLPEYYKLRGWNEQGIPTEAKMKELGLEAEARLSK